MPDLPTRLDLYALGRNYVLQTARKIDPGQVDVEGTNVNIYVGSMSVVADACIKQLGFSVARLTLDGSDGDDLDRYAYDRYTITRKGASPAVGTVRIFRAAITVGAGSVPIGTKFTTAAGIEYITTTIASFGVGDFESSAEVRAVQAGKDTQVGKNTITAFAQPGLLFDKTLQVNNDGTTAGGEDAEDDDVFRNRIRDFWNNARKGILSAIVQGAMVVPGVVSAVAIEALGADNQPARVVNLYIADSTGVASNALATLVRNSLDEYRAAGITVIIVTSLPFIVDIVLAPRYRANVDTVNLSDALRRAFVGFINSLPVNGTLYRSALGAILERFKEDGLITDDTTIVSPVGDLVPAVGQTLRTTLANVTLVAA